MMTSNMPDFQFAKDTAEPVFFSKQTNTKFILYAHLKGYKKRNVKIKLSEDGRELWVSGEKPVPKDEEVREFNKKFKIPQGVILDRIKGSYTEHQWKLKIVMPKTAKGIVSGVGIEEVEEVDKGRTEEEGKADSSTEVDQKVKEEEKVDEKPEEEADSSAEVDQKVKEEEKIDEKPEEEEEADSSAEVDQNAKEEEKVDEKPEDEVEEEDEEEEEVEQSVGEEVPKKSEEKETDQEMKKKRPRKRRKPCFPLMFGGSTFLLSLILYVILYIKSKQK